MCGKKTGGEIKEIHDLRNKKVMEAVSRKVEAHKVMCQNSIEENKRGMKA